MATILGNAYVRIRPDISGFASEAESGIKKSLGALGKLAGAAFTAAMGAATAGLGVGVKVAADMEQARIGFTTMLGSAQKADTFLRKLADFAAKTPFDFPTLQKAASRLIAVGTEADRVIPIMTVLGDATAAMGTGAEGVDRAVMALQQMQVKGKVTGEEMLQLAEAGVPAWEALASQLGVTTAEAQNLVSKGKVSVEDLFTAIETRQGESFARMNGMMDQQSQTLSGMWSTLKDTVQLQLAEMVTPLVPAIKGAMAAATPVIDSFLGSVQSKFQTLVEQTPNLLSALVDQDAQGVAEVLDNILGNTGQHIATLRNLAQEFFPVWNSVVDTFGNLRDIVSTLGPLAGVVLSGGLRLVWEAVQLLAPALASITGYLAENEWAVYTLVGALAAWKTIMLANSAILAVQGAGSIAQWIAQTRIATAVTSAWTAVQTVFNAVMAAHPIVRIVMIIGALVGALITAYQTSDTFREFVDSAFRAVAEAGRWMWESVLQPAWNAMLTAWDAVAAGISWAWSNVLQPAWDAVSSAATWLWTNVLSLVFSAIGSAWSAMVTGIKWAWDNILSPVWEVIKAAAQVLFAVLVVAIFGPIAAAWTALTTGIQWAWENILKPAWDAVSTAAQWLWNNVLSPVFSWIKAGWDALMLGIDWSWQNILRPTWNALQAAAQWLWNNVLSPVFSAISTAWDGLMRGIRWVYDNVVHPMWSIFQSALDTMRRAFDTVVDAIGTAWDKIKGFAAKPINFVIRTVLRDGLFAAFNWVIDKLGLPKDWQIDRNASWLQGIPGYASGGRVRGSSPNPKADNIPAMLTAGEWVQPVSSVRYYGSDVMEAIRTRRIPKEAIEGALHLANGGPVYQGLFDLVKKQFPKANLNSGQRASNDYHGRGMAVDLGEQGFAGGNGRPYLAAMNQWIYDNFKSQTAELIYDGLGDNRPDLKNGKDFNYGAAIQAQHRNHVHWAARSVPNGEGGNWFGDLLGGIWDSVTGVFNYIKDSITKPISDLFGQFGESDFVKIGAETAKSMPGKLWEKIKEKVAGLWDGLKSSAGKVWDFITGGGDDVRGIVQNVAKSFGWGSGPQWDALAWLIGKESSWNPKAQNPKSTAYGLFQFLDSTWASVGGRKTSDPTAQANYGLRYIQQRYGTPLGAKAFWQRNGWYSEGGPVRPFLFDEGGRLNPGLTLVDNRSRKPEAVLNNDQLRWIQAAADQGNAPLIGGDLVLQVGPGASVRDQMEEAMFQLRRIKRGGGVR